MKEIILQERQRDLVNLFARAPMKETFGMELHFNEHESAMFLMPYDPAFDHSLNQIHGGVIATLLDNAGWFTAAQYYETWISTVEMQMRLLNPAAREKLIASGNMIKKGNRIAVAEMRVETEDGNLIATGSGTFAVTSIPLES